MRNRDVDMCMPLQRAEGLVDLALREGAVEELLPDAHVHLSTTKETQAQRPFPSESTTRMIDTSTP